MPGQCASRPFPKLPKLPCSPLSDARLPAASHTHWYTWRMEQWDSTRTIGLKARQTLTCLQRELPRDFSPLLFLGLYKQTLLSLSLYSWADFCVSVCFNLNGFQVLRCQSLPPLSLLWSSSWHWSCLPLLLRVLSLSHFLSTPERHHSVPSITFPSSLPFLPFPLTSLPPPQPLVKSLTSLDSLDLPVQSGG